MASQNTQVYCCGASTWTSVFAWFQIVVAVFGIVGISVVLADMDDTRNEFVNKRRRQPMIVIISLLVFAVVSLVLGLLLLVGNKREKIVLLWAWVVLYFIDAAFGVILGSVVVVIPKAVLPILLRCILLCIFLAITGFMFRVVDKRIDDIEIGSGQMPANGA